MVKVVKMDKRVRIIINEEMRWQLKSEAAKQKKSMQLLVNEMLKKGLADIHRK